MTAQVFNIHATTNSGALSDGTSAALVQSSGSMVLFSALWSGSITNASDSLGANVFRIPRGNVMKIWHSCIGGAPANILVQSSYDGYGSSWAPVASYANATQGADSTVRYNRPVIVTSPTGNGVVRVLYNMQGLSGITWNTTSGSNTNAFCDLTVEITESNQF